MINRQVETCNSAYVSAPREETFGKIAWAVRDMGIKLKPPLLIFVASELRSLFVLSFRSFFALARRSARTGPLRPTEAVVVQECRHTRRRQEPKQKEPGSARNPSGPHHHLRQSVFPGAEETK